MTPEGFTWRLISRRGDDNVAHLIPSPLTHGAKTLCGELIDPFAGKTESILRCYRCTRKAKEAGA